MTSEDYSKEATQSQNPQTGFKARGGGNSTPIAANKRYFKSVGLKTRHKRTAMPSFQVVEQPPL